MPNIQRINISKQEKLYSDGVIFGNVLWISGMLPIDSKGDIVGKGDAALQGEQVFQNIHAVLEQAHLDFKDVVKLFIYLKNIDDRARIALVRKNCFGDNLPASTLVEVSSLAHPDALLEIEAVAYRG
ncbi:RidA family protein [Aneurinibacillus tyrosinisolvens]|uniref:RidA family protein n=1 Tax=Aneurinibacillus tyrosinisolvens TaxID=1443435 RepID=UPI001379150E|nr:RidA family protein [Aneurinibacillus tyrosinisolvens]